VNEQSLPFWSRVQLRLLRLLTAFLAIVDSLFRIRWGERLLDRMAGRWQAQLLELDQSLARLEVERHQLQSQAEALAIHAAALYLGGRWLARGELRFDPSDPHDEQVLDAAIDLLVKTRLAAIESEAVEAGRYVYHLEPDWPAIRARLTEAAALADGETAAWFQEGLKFIDDTFVPNA
jgi:hypothetical protein